MKTQLAWFFFVASSLVSAQVVFAAAPASVAKSVTACTKTADCKIIDLGCGRPGAVNLSAETPENFEACDAAANFDEASKLFTADCKNKKCELVQKADTSKIGPSKTK